MNKPEIDLNGIKRWRNSDGKLHRKHRPAIEYPNGDRSWYINDEYHRDDGPAIDDIDGTKCWYVNGKQHRENGPACEHADGTKYWYINGFLHREDGPAYKDIDGTERWYIFGVHHSEDEFNGLELIQEIASSFDISISKMDLVSKLRASVNKTTLTMLDTKISLCDPNSLNQIKEMLENNI